MKPATVRIAAVAAVVLLAAVSAGYVLHAARRSGTPAAAPSPVPPGGSAGASATSGDVAAVTGAGPYFVFKRSALDRDFGRLAVASQADPSRVMLVDGLRCNRVSFGPHGGLCLQLSGGGVFTYVDAAVLDAHLVVRGQVRLAGFPSRTRVSPDGRLAAATTFVGGDSYASMGFSTRTSIITLDTASVLFDLESLAVTKAGQPFHASDFNVWGVTFEPDSRHFYATLGSGGQTYLIHGDVQTRAAVVVTTGVECPSLSPDGTRIAFKKREPGSVVAWRLWVLDVASGQQHATAETRWVDDQAVWLDDRTVMYGLATSAGSEPGALPGSSQLPSIAAGASIDTTMWAVPSDGSGAPRVVLAHAWSAQPVG